MRAYDIMSHNVVTVGCDTPILDAIKIMLTRHISGLPVTDAFGKLIGIVSEGDFIRRGEITTATTHRRWLSVLIGPKILALDSIQPHGRTVGQIMTPHPLTIDEMTPLDRVADLMRQKNIKRLPVMRDDNIVGMITPADFMIAVEKMQHITPQQSATDDQIRTSVISSLSEAPWRPCALNVSVNHGIVSVRGSIAGDMARRAVIVAIENIPGVKSVKDELHDNSLPLPEEDYGGGDFVTLQEEPSTTDDEPL